MMKVHLERLLCRYPAVYRWILGFNREYNSEKAAYLALIRQGDTVLELGANRGIFTVLFSRIVGPGGRVEALEPVPVTFEKLQGAVANSRLTNVTCHQLAAGAVNARQTIYLPGDVDGQASLLCHEAGAWADTESPREFECEIVRIDDWLSSRGIQKIDFVKLDVEGAERPALQGMPEMLRSMQPVVHLEYEPAWMEAFGYGPEELVQTLRSAGYRIFLTYDRAFREIPDFYHFATSCNVVCLAENNQRHSELRRRLLR